jgi:hypothetical protein
MAAAPDAVMAANWAGTFGNHALGVLIGAPGKYGLPQFLSSKGG